jgi:hypothetical protein
MSNWDVLLDVEYNGERALWRAGTITQALRDHFGDDQQNLLKWIADMGTMPPDGSVILGVQWGVKE